MPACLRKCVGACVRAAEMATQAERCAERLMGALFVDADGDQGKVRDYDRGDPSAQAFEVDWGPHAGGRRTTATCPSRS